jgi:hypothetical protein
VRAPLIVVATPNVEYNVKFESLPAGQLRHGDHRFEWTRAQFADWARDKSQRYGYRVTLHPIGEIDEALGAPTQMAVFEVADASMGPAAQAAAQGAPA